MMIRQMALVACLVLTVCGQAVAGVALSVSGGVCPDFAGQNVPVSAAAATIQGDFSADLAGFGVSALRERAGWGRCEAIWPAGPDRDGFYSHFGGQDAAFLVSAAEAVFVRAPGGILLLGDVASPCERVPNPVFSVLDATSPLLDESFGVESDLQDAADAGPLPTGVNDGRQSGTNMGELSLTGTYVPAPAAVLIGGIGICLIGWTRKHRTYPS